MTRPETLKNILVFSANVSIIFFSWILQQGSTLPPLTEASERQKTLFSLLKLILMPKSSVAGREPTDKTPPKLANESKIRG